MNEVLRATPADAGWRAQVLQKLSRVMDPELDESVTDMNFIASLDMDANARVHVGFRLPTYWCAANFAFMMADDMRQAVGELPWVSGVSVTLGEHMYADKINAGLAIGQSFAETFGSEATDNLDEVRHTFLVKAFQGRQDVLLTHLLAAGQAAEGLLRWSIGDLTAVALDSVGDKLRGRYLDRRQVAGAFDKGSRAFTTELGTPIAVENFERHRRDLKRVRVNAEFNGALCRGLLNVRFDLTTPLPPRRGRKAACASPICDSTTEPGTSVPGLPVTTTPQL